jgi:hypothetical protein
MGANTTSFQFDDEKPAISKYIFIIVHRKFTIGYATHFLIYFTKYLH